MKTGPTGFEVLSEATPEIGNSLMAVTIAVASVRCTLKFILVVFRAAGIDTTRVDLIYGCDPQFVVSAIVVRHLQHFTVVASGEMLCDNSTVAAIVSNLVLTPPEDQSAR
jgi:hypothetical protein